MMMMMMMMMMTLPITLSHPPARPILPPGSAWRGVEVGRGLAAGSGDGREWRRQVAG